MANALTNLFDYTLQKILGIMKVLLFLLKEFEFSKSIKIMWF